jgi:hypothetical protein
MDEQYKMDEKINEIAQKMNEKFKWMNITCLQPKFMCQCKL